MIELETTQIVGLAMNFLSGVCIGWLLANVTARHRIRRQIKEESSDITMMREQGL